MLEAKFDKSGVIWLSPKQRKPLDARRLQSAMFMDRPDLWRPSMQRRRKRVAKEQLHLFTSKESL